jgi:hypothetical protein
MIIADEGLLSGIDGSSAHVFKVINTPPPANKKRGGGDQNTRSTRDRVPCIMIIMDLSPFGQLARQESLVQPGHN